MKKCKLPILANSQATWAEVFTFIDSTYNPILESFCFSTLILNIFPFGHFNCFHSPHLVYSIIDTVYTSIQTRTGENYGVYLVLSSNGLSEKFHKGKCRMSRGEHGRSNVFSLRVINSQFHYKWSSTPWAIHALDWVRVLWAWWDGPTYTDTRPGQAPHSESSVSDRQSQQSCSKSWKYRSRHQPYPKKPG